MSYKIGSFNVRNLSYSSRKNRDLDRLADIIKQFDIIALQEVLSEGKILTGDSSGEVSGQVEAYDYSLKSRLGDNWEIRWLDPGTDTSWYPYLGQDKRGEGYAFLWRKDKFTLPVNQSGKLYEPRIFRQYKVDKNAGEVRLIRDPAYGRFQLVDLSPAEIRLITTHIVYSKPSESNVKKTIDAGSYAMRRNEFRVIAREIYTRINDNRNFYNNAVPYTIILGDYNMNLEESGAGGPTLPSVIVFDGQKNELTTTEGIEKGGIYCIKTEQTDLSTVKRDTDQYANNYDHFSYDKKIKSEIVVGRPHRLNSVVKKSGGFQNYKEKISDHIPIMVEIDLKK